jgi:hypothetical protein
VQLVGLFYTVVTTKCKTLHNLQRTVFLVGITNTLDWYYSVIAALSSTKNNSLSSKYFTLCTQELPSFAARKGTLAETAVSDT